MAVETFAKTAVAIMTVLIVVMTGAVLWGLSRPPALKVSAVPNIANKADSVPLPAWAATLPPGKIRSISAAGGALAVLIDTPEAAEIYLFDPVDSRLIGSLREGADTP
jgi:hypothetical protein